MDPVHNEARFLKRGLDLLDLQVADHHLSWRVCGQVGFDCEWIGKQNKIEATKGIRNRLRVGFDCD